MSSRTVIIRVNLKPAINVDDRINDHLDKIPHYHFPSRVERENPSAVTQDVMLDKAVLTFDRMRRKGMNGHDAPIILFDLNLGAFSRVHAQGAAHATLSATTDAESGVDGMNRQT